MRAFLGRLKLYSEFKIVACYSEYNRNLCLRRHDFVSRRFSRRSRSRRSACSESSIAMPAGWIILLLASITTAQATQATLGSSGSNSCPALFAKITTNDQCRAAIELVAGDGDRAEHGSVGQETDAGFPSGCYFFDQDSSSGGYYFNQHPSGAGESDASPVCISEDDGFASGLTLFVGDSDIDYWATNSAFPGSYNVGIGGDTCQNVLNLIDSFLSTFAPSAVVLVCGENDLADGTSEASTFERFTELVAKITGAGARVVYMGTKPEPGTTNLHAQYAQYDQSIRGLATSLADGAASPPLAMVDVYSAFEALGNPSSLYASDELHLSSSGYGHWTTWAAEALADSSCVVWLSGLCVEPPAAARSSS